MLTSVQKEILQTLINLYQSSKGKSIKGEDIAEVMNRNPGTIRNQMQSLRSLSLVKGVPGPRGGYKPTIEAYHSLNISISDNETKIPIYCNDKKLEDISVAKIEFTSVPQPDECEAAIKVLGNIKELNLGDTLRIGPTPVNSLGVMGEIVGRDDVDNVLLVDTTTIRSIPKQKVGNIATRNVITLQPDFDLKQAAEIFSKNAIDGAPVLEEDNVVGVFTVSDLIRAIAEGNDDLKVRDLMSTKVIIINENLRIVDAIEIIFEKEISRLIIVDNNDQLVGIVTRTDLINSMTNLKHFPIVKE